MALNSKSCDNFLIEKCKGNKNSVIQVELSDFFFYKQTLCHIFKFIIPMSVQTAMEYTCFKLNFFMVLQEFMTLGGKDIRIKNLNL